MLLFVLQSALAFTLDVPAYNDAGTPFTILVTDLQPNQTLHFAVSGRGEGQGPCPAVLGGQCLSVVRPIHLTRTADANGTVTLSHTLTDPEARFCFQAVSLVGGVEISPVQCMDITHPSIPATLYGLDYVLEPEPAYDLDIARGRCAERGMHLLTLESEFERDFVDTFLVAEGVLSTWMDITDLDSEGTWVDSMANPATWFDWLPGEPNNDSGAEHCASFITTLFGRGMNDVTCDGSGDVVVCEADGRTSLLGNHIYLQRYMTTDWFSAAQICEARNGWLVSVDNAVENSMIQAMAQYMDVNVWLAANDQAVEGGWVDGDNTPLTFTNWRPGEPNDSAGNEDCGELVRTDGGWNDNSCAAQRNVVCELP